MNKFFRQFAEKVSFFAGTSWAFIGALAVILGWAASGRLFGFSEQWQLVINSVTTIVTFLMVFVIQNTQNRDFKALHLKLDELIRADEDAHHGLIALQNLSDEELNVIEKGFERLRRRRAEACAMSSRKSRNSPSRAATAAKRRIDDRNRRAQSRLKNLSKYPVLRLVASRRGDDRTQGTAGEAHLVCFLSSHRDEEMIARHFSAGKGRLIDPVA